MTAEVSDDWLVPGTVIKIYTFNTEPPKYKRCVIVGVADPPTMIAVIYFNTDKAPSPFVAPYQIAFSGSEDFLEHDCYLDCAQVLEESKSWINHQLSNNRESSVLGRLSGERLEEVLSTVRKAPTTTMKLKKKYGIC